VIVVIDVQERLEPVMPREVRRQLKKSLSVLAETSRQLGIPVLITEQYPKGLGPTLPSLREQFAVAPVFEKSSFSALGSGAFSEALAESGRRQVILAGMEAHICVLQTALELLSEGYEVQVLVDAVASRRRLHWQNGLERMRAAGVQLSNTESFAFECLGSAGTTAFKAIARAIR